MTDLPIAPAPHPASPNRRAVLRGGLVIGAGVVVAATVSACESGPTPNQTTAEALLPLARSADADAAAARDLAPRVTEYSAALTVVADQRTRHAQALTAEITRLDQDIAARVSETASPSAPVTPTPTAPAGTATLDDLRTALTSSAKSARQAAISLSGYSAGLAGSVSASTTTLVEVQLG
ncbi:MULTISPECIES: hypothetical protein [Gordonia]|uniref:hypothetical protein n=1 Tax=Gordonia sp. NB41Y TaxID=875808 RepID=UPI001FD518B8|nr:MULTISPECIES: hypothetical protein [Gordonia]WLP91160.1 hypothetical protein Q9K23_02450 [Gordonia sp. NB41Y]